MEIKQGQTVEEPTYPKWMQTLIKKHGSVEAVRRILSENGKKGGSVKTRKGFAVTGTASEAGRISAMNRRIRALEKGNNV